MIALRPDRIRLDGVAKTFVMHLRGGTRIAVVHGVSISVRSGECVVPAGPSGIGKCVLKLIYGSYRADAGHILVTGESGTVDVVSASPRQMLALRQTTLGYVRQILRTIPRIGALEIVAAARREGVPPEAARARARAARQAQRRAAPLGSAARQLLRRRAVARKYRARSGDPPSRAAPRRTLRLTRRHQSRDRRRADRGARKRKGATILGIFHDANVRQRMADRIIDVTQFAFGA